MKPNKSKFSVQPHFQKIKKPWGYEIILTPPDSSITGKIIHLDDGKRFSFQYHDEKTEALTLISGEAYIILEDNQSKMKKMKMEKNKGYFIKPFQKHRCQGIKDCLISEVSTKESGKTVRLEDDYNRGTETEKKRQQRAKSKVYME